MSLFATPGERLFAMYLTQRGLSYEHEPAVGCRHPDFVVDHDRIGRVAWEVYEPHHRLPNRVGGMDPYTPIRSAFNGRKYEQAKASRAAGLPHVVVLGRSNSDIPFDPLIVAGAMFGNVGVTFRAQLDSDGQPAPTDTRTSFFSGGRLQPEMNRSVSALAILTSFNPTIWRVQGAYESRLDEMCLRVAKRPSRRDHDEVVRVIMETHEEFMRTGVFDLDARLARITVLHNPHAALPLDMAAAAGPHDEQWGIIVDDGTVIYGQIASGVCCHEIPGRRNQAA